MKTGELHCLQGRLSNQEYLSEFGDDMQHKPVLDAKVEELCQIFKQYPEVGCVIAWLEYPFWEGYMHVFVES